MPFLNFWLNLFIKKPSIQTPISSENNKVILKLNQIIIEINDLIWEKMGEFEGNFPNLNQTEKDFIHISLLKGQVDNGGFDQFFFNTSGAYCNEIADSLKHIGAFRTLEIATSAFQLFPEQPIPVDVDIRRAFMENLDRSISDGWGGLDDQFYDSGEDLEIMLLRHLMTNPDNAGFEVIEKNKAFLEAIV